MDKRAEKIISKIKIGADKLRTHEWEFTRRYGGNNHFICTKCGYHWSTDYDESDIEGWVINGELFSCNECIIKWVIE